MIQKMHKNRIVKNAGWIIFGKVAQTLINLVVGLLTARYLGPANYGIINYAAAYTGFFTAICNLGINSIMVKELMDDPEKEGQTLGTSVVLRAVSAIFSSIVILCIVSVMDAGDPVTIVTVGLCSLGLVFRVFEIFNYWFQSKLQSKVTALISLAAYVITSIYKVILLVSGQGVIPFALATSVDYVCIAILLLVAYRKYGGQSLSFSLRRGKQILSKSWHFILPSLMVAVYAQTDKIMLKQIIGDSEIGYYSTAVSTACIWCFVLSAIIDSMYPSIMEAFKADQRQFEKRNKQLYAIVFYLSMFVSVMFTLFGGIAVKILYGDAYLPSVAPLRIVTWYTAFSYLGVARNAWIVSNDKQKYLIYLYFASAISNIILNAALIPFLGATGAAVASLITQITTTLIVPFFIKPLRENSKLMVEAIFFRF